MSANRGCQPRGMPYSRTNGTTEAASAASIDSTYAYISPSRDETNEKPHAAMLIVHGSMIARAVTEARMLCR
jgi:hypothetical protein